MTDQHGQPANQMYNFSRNREKALFGLKGILSGVIADKELNEQELLFLDIWLKSQQHLGRDSDVIDLLDLISDILSDKRVSQEELDDLNDLITDILDYRQFSLATDESKINELYGYIAGIAADGILNEKEIISLKLWLQNNETLRNTWPASILFEKIEDILEDGIVTTDEADHLLTVLKEIDGNSFDDTGIAHGLSTKFLEDEVKQFNHDGRCICFSGQFVTGNRKVVQRMAEELGASIKANITKSVDTLVIGTIASRDWRFSSHGRKIEKAVKLKESGHNIIILTERTWLRFI